MTVWLEEPEIRYFHEELIKEHGGLAGLRDEGALAATIARPQNLISYQPKSSIYDLAACYGFGFAKNHVLSDGNKRIALTAISVFLLINGFALDAEEHEAVLVITNLAAGEIDEAMLSAWIAKNSAPFEL